MTDNKAPWQNRIIGSGIENPQNLLANPKNWRVHPEKQQKALEGALNEVGWVQNVIVNQRTGCLVDGHLRVTLALRREEAEIPVTYVDLTEREEAIILATIDPISSLAVADKHQLRDLVDDIQAGDADLQEFISEMAFDLGAFELPETESSNTQKDLNPVIQYNIVFDTDYQQERWYGFIRYLKTCYPDMETLGERLQQFVEDGNYDAEG